MAHVGEILAELRNDRELSQKELGRVLHIGGGTISCYERGSSLPNSDRIAQIADYFHVTTDYLLGRTCLLYTSLYPNDCPWRPSCNGRKIYKR